jgi:hypothetical protein
MSIGNHWAYRIEYLTGPGLPCPTPHVRELEHTQQPQAVLAEILGFKSYIASRNGRPCIGIRNAENQELPKFQNFSGSCLVCRQAKSEYDGLRLKCN